MGASDFSIPNGGRTPRTLERDASGVRDRHHVRGSSRDARHFGARLADDLGEPRDVATPSCRPRPRGRSRGAAGGVDRRDADRLPRAHLALRPPTWAPRVPVLAFAAAFLVSFNVFGNFDGLLPHVRREDPLTATTASTLSILDADASAEQTIHDKATAKTTAASVPYPHRRRHPHPRRPPAKIGLHEASHRRPSLVLVNILDDVIVVVLHGMSMADWCRLRPHPRLHLRPRLRWTLARSAPSNTRSTRVTS